MVATTTTTTTTTTKPSSTEDPQPEQPRILPKAYKPGPCTVLIGRGKKCRHHPGNILLRKLVRDEYLTAYEESARSDKSVLLLQLVRKIRKSNDDGIGFVKKDLTTGRWYEITDFATRIYVAQTFRDELGSSSYKSSKQGKYEQRQLKKLQHFTKKGGYCPFPAYLPLSSSPQLPLSNGSTTSTTGFSLEDAIASSRMKNQEFMAKTGVLLPQIQPPQQQRLQVPRFHHQAASGNFPTMVSDQRFAPATNMSMMMRTVSSEEIMFQQQQQHQQQWAAGYSPRRNWNNLMTYNPYHDVKAAGPLGHPSALPAANQCFSATNFSSYNYPPEALSVPQDEECVPTHQTSSWDYNNQEPHCNDPCPAKLDFPRSEPDQDLFPDPSDLQDNHHDGVLVDLELDHHDNLKEEEGVLTPSSVFGCSSLTECPGIVEEKKKKKTTEGVVPISDDEEESVLLEGQLYI